MIIFKIIISFVFFISKNVLTLNQFSLHSVYDENNDHGTYIRPAISENGYLYIMTGEDDPKENRNRYIVKFDINSGTFIEQINYKSNYGFLLHIFFYIFLSFDFVILLLIFF